MRPLFAITDDLLKLNDMLDECEGDLSKLGGAENEFVVWLDNLGMEESIKLDNYIMLIKQLEMEAVAARAEKEQWAAREKSRTERVAFLKDRLKKHLELTGRDKVATETGRVIAIQKNGGKPPLVLEEEKFNGLTDSELKELEHMGVIVLQPMLEKSHLFDLLRGGTTFEWARIGEAGTHLRIK